MENQDNTDDSPLTFRDFWHGLNDAVFLHTGAAAGMAMCGRGKVALFLAGVALACAVASAAVQHAERQRPPGQ